MRTNHSNGKRKFLALLMSMMMLSTSAVALAACKNSNSSTSTPDKDDSSTSTSTPIDKGLIKNAGFETFDDNDGLNPIVTSPTGWTKAVNSETSGSAPTSKSASGIIDVESKAWDELTTSNLSALNVTMDELVETEKADKAKEVWDELTIKDKLEFYKAYEDKFDDEDYPVKDLEFYENFNIKASDLPTEKDLDGKETAPVNPKTHYAETDTENADKTKIYMLRNNYYNDTYKNGFGTAQKLTSSSTVTVAAGTTAKFSVWVKTYNLRTATSDYQMQDASDDAGAYIRITNSIGGNSLDPLEIKNINTQNIGGLDSTNGWKQYEFYLTATTFADSSFTVVLGLGQNAGTDRLGYVDGYAFFDDIQCETVKTENVTLPQGTLVFDVDDTTESKVIDYGKTANQTKKAFALDYSGVAGSSKLNVSNLGFKTAPTSEKIGGNYYTSGQAGTDINGKPMTPYTDGGFGNGLYSNQDKFGTFTFGELASSTDSYLQTVCTNYFANETATDDVLLLLSTSGVAQTARLSNGTQSPFSLQDGEYMAISFFVKTSDLSSMTGAGVTLVETDGNKNKSTISGINTFPLKGVTIGEEEDVYDGWQRCFFFVENDSGDARDFYLEFTFGSLTVNGTDKSAYKMGFVAYKDFEIFEMGKESYAYATSNTYAKLVTFKEVDDTANGDNGFDTPAGVPTDAIETGYAKPSTYGGYYHNAQIVTGGGKTASGETTVPANPNTTNDAYGKLQTGLLNKEHAKNYTDILSTLAGVKNETATWEGLFGNATQPLVIYNETAQTKAYGYIGKKQTISAGGYTTVSVRVKSVNATAYIYLIDTDDMERSTLSIGANRTYWYDADGNVWTADPAENTSEKRYMLFKLQDNGLYKYNASYSGDIDVTNIDKDAYYANLSAYTQKDLDGNLLVGDNGVSYNYTNKWLNDGNDGIAYYYNEEDGKYYAESALKTPVLDLASVSVLPTRTDAQEKQELFFEVAPTNGEWVTYTFYIHAGDLSKNYRLEVWNGARDGSVVNSANSYIFVDSYQTTALDDTSWAKLIKQRKDEVAKSKYFESVFSLYDSEKFLRYDKTADENGVGANTYETFLAEAPAKGVAYLAYDNEIGDGEYTRFVDYAHSETEFTADSEEENDSSSDKSDSATSETNIWLLVSSILVSAVLVLAVISLVVRKIVLRIRRKRGYVPTSVKKERKKAKKEKKAKNENND